MERAEKKISRDRERKEWENKKRREERRLERWGQRSCTKYESNINIDTVYCFLIKNERREKILTLK